MFHPERAVKIDPARGDKGKFKIRVARMEMVSPNERGEDIRLTFQFESHKTSFALPIFLNSCEFEDTEIVKIARSKLHDVFRHLGSQCEDWQVSGPSVASSQDQRAARR